jgi:NAD+ synthase (glutamine-hydrolysing)
MNPVRVALAQINPTVGAIDKNAGLILDSLRKAQESGCDIIVFPELSVSGYPPEDLLLKQSFLAKCREAVEYLAGETTDIVALVGSPWKFNWGKHRHEFNRNGEEIYNSAIILADKKVQDIYFKTELPNYGVFDEKRYFSRLETPECLVFVMNGVRFCITICEDIWIDQSPVRTLAAMNNVDVTLNLSASPFFAGKLTTSRYEALSQYCLKTGTSLVYTNLIGGQDELVFDGTSMVLDHRGKIRHMAKRFEEDLLIVDLDESFVKNNTDGYLFRDYYPTTSSIERDFAQKFDLNLSRETIEIHPATPQEQGPFNDFVDVLRGQTEAEEVYLALKRGLVDYVDKNEFPGVVVAVSGGVDSAVTLALAVEALGPERVTGITMPSKLTSRETEDDATLTMKNLGVKYDCVPIAPVVRQYVEATMGNFLWKEAGKGKGVVWENIQARVRGNILMAFSNQFNWLVLSTGNKSETAVGYCTMYGDMVGGFSLLKDVYKTLVYKIGHYINVKRAERGLLGIPATTFDRAPSAELAEDQTDEAVLGPYRVLDKVLEAYIEKEMPVKEMKDHFGALCFPPLPDMKAYVEKIVRMVDRNEYKRRQGCPGVKITPKAFGKDRRMPITNGYI